MYVGTTRELSVHTNNKENGFRNRRIYSWEVIQTLKKK